MRRVICLMIILNLCASCVLFEPAPEYVGVPAYLVTPPTPIGQITLDAPGFKSPPNGKWHIQYTGNMDFYVDAEIYNIDLFDTDQEIITALRSRGVFVMCYFNAGAYEDWRPDAIAFPIEALGNDMEGREGETWLDIRLIDALAPVMESRLDLAAEKGCDGVDPDNINGYENETGFPLTYNDQVAYNVYLSRQAHKRGLSIGLKNDLNQIPELLPYFDWILNESCFDYQECDLLMPFIQAGKPVFIIEYELDPDEFCAEAKAQGFNAIHKNLELDAYTFWCGVN